MRPLYSLMRKGKKRKCCEKYKKEDSFEDCERWSDLCNLVGETAGEEGDTVLSCFLKRKKEKKRAETCECACSQAALPIVLRNFHARTSALFSRSLSLSPGGGVRGG